MAKKLRTYRIRGVIKGDFPIDVDTKVQAYSKKQARLKLAFKVLENRRLKIPLRKLINQIKKSRLLIQEIR